MAYDIIVRFPDKETADAFAAEMSDGAGEGLCDFTSWHQKPGTDGKKHEDFEHITSSAPEGTPVYFVNSILSLE